MGERIEASSEGGIGRTPRPARAGAIDGRPAASQAAPAAPDARRASSPQSAPFAADGRPAPAVGAPEPFGAPAPTSGFVPATSHLGMSQATKRMIASGGRNARASYGMADALRKGIADASTYRDEERSEAAEGHGQASDARPGERLGDRVRRFRGSDSFERMMDDLTENVEEGSPYSTGAVLKSISSELQSGAAKPSLDALKASATGAFSRLASTLPGKKKPRP